MSVVTLGELELGVLSADDGDTRARRASTLSTARASDPVPIVTQDDDFDSMAHVHTHLSVERV